MNNKVKAKLIRKLAEKAQNAAVCLFAIADEVAKGRGKAGAALWTIYHLWSGSEYKAIEELLRQGGAKGIFDKGGK